MDEDNQTYTIDDYIADGIDKIYETINNVDVKLDDNLNDLKEVNDTLGHIAGDTLIMNFAHIIMTFF